MKLPFKSEFGKNTKLYNVVHINTCIIDIINSKNSNIYKLNINISSICINK